VSRIDREEPGMTKAPDGGLNRSDLALIRRGVSSAAAVRLRAGGYTLAKLKQMNRDALRKLGLNKLVVKNISGEGRPAIPTPNLIEVLYANRFMCCICRNPKRPIIVHHIKPWANSKSHHAKNLAVLCEFHHGKVHTKAELTRTLDANTLRGLKVKWEREVAKMDPAAILDQSREHFAAWVYFNHLRLFELAVNVGVTFKLLDGYKTAVALRHCDRGGQLLPRSNKTDWMYDGGDGSLLYRYVRSVLEATLAKLTVANISDDFDRGVLSVKLKPGDFVLVQGAHVFAKENSRNRRPGQTTSGSRRANRVAVEFTIDRWEATSSSAHDLWLSGRYDVTSIVRVSTLSKSKAGKLLIQGTSFAIAQGFSGFKTREYATFPYRAGGYIADRDDDDAV
jgi:hypothetical protein